MTNMTAGQIWKRSAVTACMILLFSATLTAQETQRFTFDLGAGFTPTVGNTGRQLDNGWNIKVGAGINFSRYAGAMIDLAYNRFDINGTTLANAGFPGGNFQVFSATLDPIVHLAPGHRMEPYLIGGGGLYRATQQFTQPSAATLVGFNPFFGFYDVTVPITEILSSYSVNKPGVNIGAGFAFGTKWRGKFFAESRYHRIFMGNDRHADYVPVSFGFRW